MNGGRSRTRSAPGGPTWVLGAPDPRARRALVRDYVGFVDPAPASASWVEAPRGTATIIINLADRFGGLPDAFAAGLADTYTTVAPAGPIVCLDLKLSPLGAYRLLGLPMSELTGRTVDLRDVVGPAAGRLIDRLREASGWADRFDLLDAFLLARAERGPEPAPAVRWAWQRLTATAGRVPIRELAEEIGWSHRHLIAKFREQTGLPPKTLARVIRFDHLLGRLDAQDPATAPRFAELAAECGYYDQAHLDRDFREFAGTTPTDYWCARQARSIPSKTTPELAT